MENSKMLINSEEISDLKNGDHIFNSELQSDENGLKLITKEFVFEKFLDKKDKNHIKDLELETDSIPAEIRDIRFPKVSIKADICCGYFKTEKDSEKGFVVNLLQLAEQAKGFFESKYGKL